VEKDQSLNNYIDEGTACASRGKGVGGGYDSAGGAFKKKKHKSIQKICCVVASPADRGGP
jgi:hypothetical protein